MKGRAMMATAMIVALVSGCGGGNGGGGTPPPPPAPSPSPNPSPTPTPTPSNSPPTISLSAASSVSAGTPLPFDASATTDAENDALTFSWDFGDGGRGGLASIAHVYPGAGNYTVTLTVTDARGATSSQQKAITVNAAATAGPPVNTLAIVRDAAGNPISGVAVTVAGSTATANTGADGRASIATAVGVPVALAFNKAGFAAQSKTMNLPAAAESGYVEVTMLAREPALTLTDAAAGGTLAGKDGARVTFPANALVNAGGTAVTGAVQVHVTPVDVGANVQAFPGKFEGVRPDGAQGIILSYGTVEFALSQAGAPLNLAPGKTATIEIPVYTTLNRDGSEVELGDTYPLWSLDEKTGLWIEEGTGTVVASTTSPSGFALRGEVGHFSWWNHDIFDIPPYLPKPLCLVDTDHDGILEDLTGTGYCWHYGTGPDQPGLNTQPKLSRKARAAQRALTQAATTRRLPAVAAYDSTPAAGGKVLPIPADLDISFVSTAKNGTLRGTRVLRGNSNLEENVTIVLYPVGAAGQNEAITLPYDQSFVLSSVGELDGFNFTVAANQQVEVIITPAQGANVTGSFAVMGPGNAVLDVGSLDPSGTPVIVTTTTAGQHRIELTAASGVPGGYRIQVRTLGCDTETSVTLPLEQEFDINGGALACFNVPLPANTALSFEVPFYSAGLSGTLSVLNGAGAELGRTEFSGSFGGPELALGVRQAGTYRIRVANAQPGPGSFTLRASTTTSQPLAVPASASWNDVTSSEAKRILVTPPADGLHSLQVTSESGAILMNVAPQGASAPTSLNAPAMAVRAHPDVLPVVDLVRTSGTPTAEVTLTTGVPQPLTLDADLSGDVGDDPLIYWFDGVPGQRVTGAIATTDGFSATFELRKPDGSVLNVGPNLFTLPTLTTGVHTAVVRRNVGLTGDVAFVARLNSIAAPEALTLTAPTTSRTFNLQLGEARHFTLSLAQAEVLGLNVSTPGGMDVAGVINGIDFTRISTGSPPGPRSWWSPGAYVRTAGEYTLRVYAMSPTTAAASGSVTVALRKPDPMPVAINAVGSANVSVPSFEAARFVTAAGRYLLRFTRSGIECCAYARLWAPSSMLTNYTGELTLAGGEEGTALLAAGNHTLTLERHSGAVASESVTFALVDLETPAALTVGGAAVAGALDAAGERDYAQFAGVGGQSYTLTLNAGFSGNVRVHKLATNGDYTERFFVVSPLPAAFAANTPVSIPFTIPTTGGLGSGSYIVEVSGTGDATGNYSVSIAP